MGKNHNIKYQLNYITGNCKYCGVEFRKRTGIHGVCSAKCRGRNCEYNKEYRRTHRTKPELHININCSICGKEFIRQGNMQKFCGNRQDKSSCSYKVYRQKGIDSKKSKYHTPKRFYSMYEYGAKKRGYVFDLTMEDFMEFWEKPCYYCSDLVEYIGIDRRDNSKGYIKTNVVSCCSQCNFFKKAHSEEYLIEKCMKITKTYLKRTEGEEESLKQELSDNFIEEELNGQE